MQINHSLFPPILREVAWLFQKQGAEIRLVGGCVRDILSGRNPKDWDCATTTQPEETFKILDQGGYNPFDISNGHGTISFIADGETYEITTLRVDVETDGRHAKVEFIQDFRTDAARRDFTINAMSADPITGDVFDYFNGYDDLCSGQIRFVGNPNERIEEDALRILRYFRFIGKINCFKLHRPSYKAVSEGRTKLNKISGERIWMEIKQIMSDPNAERIVHLMVESGVARQLGFGYPRRQFRSESC